VTQTARHESSGDGQAVGAPPTRQDRRRIGVVALVCLLGLTVIASLSLFVPSAYAPRVNVRWAEGVDDTTRRDGERALNLLAGAHVDGRTWAYDLGDASPEAIAGVIAHPSVEDTHYIERSRRVVSAEAPQGTTRVRGGLSLLREAALVPWVGRLAWCVLIVSVLWLVTTGMARG
jgi:hypothetical protein